MICDPQMIERKYCTHLQKGQKNNPGYYRPSKLTSIPEKIKEQVLWKQIPGHRNKKKMIVTVSM